MNNEYENIDDLIGKVLSSEASSAELLSLEEWLRSDTSNQKYFDNLKAIFDRASSTVSDLDFDTDAAWNKVSARIVESIPNGKVVQMHPVKSNPLRWKVAAVVTTLIGTVTALYLFFGNSGEEFSYQSQNDILIRELADGSRAVLNKNTSLTFEVAKNGKKRHAELKGEAFFEVVHDEKSEFVIESDGVFVRDIGTAFNVKAIRGSDSVEVFVKEGEVEFYSKSNRGIHLVEGQYALYLRSKDEFIKNESPENLSPDAFFSKKFRFRDASLSQVVNSLNDAFVQKFIIADEALANCRITVSFDEEDPEVIAQIIAETLGIDVNVNAERIVFSGNSCRE